MSQDEITLEVSSSQISAVNRKLKAVWTMEAAHDLRSIHNISAADELSAAISRDITEEIDREILRDLRSMVENDPYFAFEDSVKDEITDNLIDAEEVHNRTPRQQKFRSIDD